MLDDLVANDSEYRIAQRELERCLSEGGFDGLVSAFDLAYRDLEDELERSGKDPTPNDLVVARDAEIRVNSLRGECEAEVGMEGLSQKLGERYFGEAMAAVSAGN